MAGDNFYGAQMPRPRRPDGSYANPYGGLSGMMGPVRRRRAVDPYLGLDPQTRAQLDGLPYAYPGQSQGQEDGSSPYEYGQVSAPVAPPSSSVQTAYGGAGAAVRGYLSARRSPGVQSWGGASRAAAAYGFPTTPEPPAPLPTVPVATSLEDYTGASTGNITIRRSILR
jgi:hypothetical protein